MKKEVFIPVLALYIMLAISCEVKTNFTEDGHYGKVIVHNEPSSGKTIARIGISDASLIGSTTYYNERVTLAPGKSSNEYELKLTLIYDLLFSYYRVTVTLDDNTTKSLNISAYEDIVNNLYFNGTDLVER